MVDKIGIGDLVHTPSPAGCWSFQPLGDVLEVNEAAGTALVRRDNHLNDGAGQVTEEFPLGQLEIAIPLAERDLWVCEGAA